MSTDPAGSPDVVVVGAGLAGLSVAWRLAADGARVRVVDGEDPGQGASHVAAGMLAPVTEAEADDPDGLALGVAAAAAWPAFAARLGDAAGRDVGLRSAGTLSVARDRDEAEALDRARGIHERLGLAVERLLPSAARRLEPALAPTLRLGLVVPEDRAVDPRRVVDALEVALSLAGGRVVAGRRVRRIVVEGRRATGVELEDGERLVAGATVVAAGAWSGAIEGLPASARIPVRPVKGQLLVLRDPAGPGLVSRTVRFGAGYLVPRDDGRYVLGATTEERGFDTTITAWALHDLLRDGAELVPGVLELRLDEVLAGLRPSTPDGIPAIGPAGDVDGLFWCTGHHRNGVLLTPLNGPLLAHVMGSRPARSDRSDDDLDPTVAADLLARADPRRLAPAAHAGGGAAGDGDSGAVAGRRGGAAPTGAAPTDPVPTPEAARAR